MNEKIIKKIPINWEEITKQTKCTKGKLCKTAFGWGVLGGNGGAHFAIINPPKTKKNETLRIEGNEWIIYERDKE